MRGIELDQRPPWRNYHDLDKAYTTLGNVNGMGPIIVPTAGGGTWGSSGASGSSGTSGTSGTSGVRRSHSDYLSQNTINYSDYIAENLDKSINFSEYIAESVFQPTTSNKSKILNVSNTQGIEFKQTKSKVVNALDLLR